MSQETIAQSFSVRIAAVLLPLSTAVMMTACANPTPAPKPVAAAPAAPVVVAQAPAPAPIVVAQAAAPAPAAPVAPPWWHSLPSGRVQCELGESLTLNNVSPGNHVDLVWKGATHKLKNVPTSSGAYRYEEASSGIVLIHIPAKMMLMNQKQGKRLADDCRI
jgi:hypothetical protein